MSRSVFRTVTGTGGAATRAATRRACGRIHAGPCAAEAASRWVPVSRATPGELAEGRRLARSLQLPLKGEGRRTAAERQAATQEIERRFPTAVPPDPYCRELEELRREIGKGRAVDAAFERARERHAEETLARRDYWAAQRRGGRGR